MIRSTRDAQYDRPRKGGKLWVTLMQEATIRKKKNRIVAGASSAKLTILQTMSFQVMIFGTVLLAVQVTIQLQV